MVSPEQAQATGEVVSLEHLGDVTILGVRIDAATNLTLKFAGDTPARIGDRVHIGFELTGTSLFDGSDTAIS